MIEQKGKKPPGAGIILVRYFDGIPMVLGLMDKKYFDLPKGTADPGESALQTAIRETKEESGITSIDFRWGLKAFVLGSLTMFIAVTDEEPVIMANPVTLKFEHQFAKWLQFDSEPFKPWLRPAVQWASKIVQGS